MATNRNPESGNLQITNQECQQGAEESSLVLIRPGPGKIQSESVRELYFIRGDKTLFQFGDLISIFWI